MEPIDSAFTDPHLTAPKDSPLIESNVERISDSSSDGLGFRAWHYAAVPVALTWHGVATPICIDSGCTMSLIDRAFLEEHARETEVKHIKVPISVRGIGATRHLTNEYVVLDLYIHGEIPGQGIATAHLQREAHVVDNLKAKLLLEVDILTPEGMRLDFQERRLIIHSCKSLNTPLSITARDNVRLRRSVRTKKRQLVAPHSVTHISIKLKDIPEDRDFDFEPQYPGTYAHIIDAESLFVLVRNDGDRTLVIPRHQFLGTVTECQEEGYYLADPEDDILAIYKHQEVQSEKKDEIRLLNGVAIHGDQSRNF